MYQDEPITESFIFKTESASVLHCEKKVEPTYNFKAYSFSRFFSYLILFFVV